MKYHLAGNEVGYLFRVTANFDGTSKTDIFEDFVIRDDLILRVNGDSRGVANDKGKMVVKWIPVDDYTNKKFAIRYRKLPGNQFSKGWQPQAAGDGDWSILTDVEPTPTYEEPTPGNRTLASLHYPVEGLDRYQIYGVQLFYTSENVTTGEKVTHFSAREAYVFPSERQPDQGVTVGTFPFAGHFPSKTYTYSICRDSFDNDSAKQQLWVGMINHAFKQWETATDGLITMRPSGLPCTQYTSPLQEHHLTTDRTRSEIRMMNLEETAGWEVLNYFEMQADPFKRCVVRAIACATSYHGFIVPRKATNDLKASDITFNKFEIKKLVGMYETPNKPDSVSFNACVDGTSPQLNDNWDMKYFLYATAVHEGGHALGLMDWAVISLFHPPYSVAHATAKGSAMNYDNKIPGGSFKEPDCAPHPLDIMAIFALYQVVP